MPKRLIKERPVLFISVIAILVLLGFSKSIYLYFTSDEEAPPAAIEVQTVRVKVAAMPELIETVGTLTARDELPIKAAGAGKIQKLLVEAGTYVKEGTLLAHTVGAPEVRAPFDGYLTDWLVKPGEYVVAGALLIDLVNTEFLSLTYRVPESYSAKLDVNQLVEVSVKAFPNQIFQGVVKFISPIVDRKTYTILIRATVDNSDQNLWPGMSAHVRHILVDHKDALVIPESCLILTLEGYETLVVEKGKVEKRTIKIGAKRKGRVQVLSGLALGESVIMVRTNLVTEGANAVAVEWTGDW